MSHCFEYKLTWQLKPGNVWLLLCRWEVMRETVIENTIEYTIEAGHTHHWIVGIHADVMAGRNAEPFTFHRHGRWISVQWELRRMHRASAVIDSFQYIYLLLYQVVFYEYIGQSVCALQHDTYLIL